MVNDEDLWVCLFLHRLFVDVMQNPAARDFGKVICHVMISVRNELKLDFEWRVLALSIEHQMHFDVSKQLELSYHVVEELSEQVFAPRKHAVQV